MRIIDTTQVLAKIQAFNNRNVDDAVVRVWHEILADYDLQDCLRAVTDHFKNSREWVMPTDITGRVKEYRKARLNEFKYDVHLNPADETALLESGEWKDASRELIRLAASGHITPDQYDAYQSGTLALTDLTRKELTQ